MLCTVIQHGESDRLPSVRKLQGLTKQWLIWEWESQMSFLAVAQQHCINAKGQRFNLFRAVGILKACHTGSNAAQVSSGRGTRWERPSDEVENAVKEINSLTCPCALMWGRKYCRHQTPDIPVYISAYFLGETVQLYLFFSLLCEAAHCFGISCSTCTLFYRV